MSHRPDPMLQTLYRTSITDTANFRRLDARLLDNPNARDIAEDIMEDGLVTLHRALTWPLDSTGWRRVDLLDGRYAEVFNHAAGTTYALRDHDGLTVWCRTYQSEQEAVGAFAMAVYLDTHRER